MAGIKIFGFLFPHLLHLRALLIFLVRQVDEGHIQVDEGGSKHQTWVLVWENNKHDAAAAIVGEKKREEGRRNGFRIIGFKEGRNKFVIFYRMRRHFGKEGLDFLLKKITSQELMFKRFCFP